MMKMKKIVALATIVLITLVALTSTSSAMTKAELKDYICSEHGVNGRSLKISGADKEKVEKFFKNNEITDEQAAQIKSSVDEAISIMNNDGVSNPKDLSSPELKQRLLACAQEAAGVLGLTVTYDSTSESLDVYKDGVLYESFSLATPEAALVQTGSTNYIYVVAGCVMLIAGIMLIVSRKNRLSAKAN